MLAAGYPKALIRYTTIQITIMIDTQQQYIKLNIRGEISIIVVQAHSGRKRDLSCITCTLYTVRPLTQPNLKDINITLIIIKIHVIIYLLIK
jgi:hypothetical protein